MVANVFPGYKPYNDVMEAMIAFNGLAILVFCVELYFFQLPQQNAITSEILEFYTYLPVKPYIPSWC